MVFVCILVYVNTSSNMFKNNARFNRNYRNNNNFSRRRNVVNKNNRLNRQPKLIFRKLPKGFINSVIRENPVPIYPRKRNNIKRKGNNNKVPKIIKEVKDFLVPKVTNINRSKKEPRKDLIITPMQMALESKFMSIYQTPNRITYMSVYTKFYMDSDTQLNTYIMWFPYCVPFNNYNNTSVRVDSTSSNTLATAMSNIIKIVTNFNHSISTANRIPCGVCGILGMYRLVGATMKITNLTSLMNKSGSYSVYRLTESEGYPCFYSDNVSPDYSNSPNYFGEIRALCTKNHDQISIKQTYASNDICHINEFNLTQGNTIFSKADEYIGNSFSSSTDFAAKWNNNPDGVNIKYLVHIPSTTTANNYMFETWSVIELIPDPTTHLDSLAQLQSKDQLMTKKRIEAMRHMNPLSKN